MAARRGSWVWGTLIALAVIGTVVAMAIVVVRDQIRRAQEFYIGAITDAEYAHARASAERLVAALDAYHTAHGAYPPALADLAPEFIPEVPTLTGPQPTWDYGLAGDDFWLSFWVGPIYETDSYRPSHGWSRDR